LFSSALILVLSTRTLQAPCNGLVPKTLAIPAGGALRGVGKPFFTRVGKRYSLFDRSRQSTRQHMNVYFV
jgi:hypothetical protein